MLRWRDSFLLFHRELDLLSLHAQGRKNESPRTHTHKRDVSVPFSSVLAPPIPICSSLKGYGGRGLKYRRSRENGEVVEGVERREAAHCVGGLDVDLNLARGRAQGLVEAINSKAKDWGLTSFPVRVCRARRDRTRSAKTRRLSLGANRARVGSP